MDEGEYNDLIFPYKNDFDQCENEDEVINLFGHRVRRCKRIRFDFERPEINEAKVIDGDGYFAELLSSEDFGCVLFESID